MSTNASGATEAHYPSGHGTDLVVRLVSLQSGQPHFTTPWGANSATPCTQSAIHCTQLSHPLCSIRSA